MSKNNTFIISDESINAIKKNLDNISSHFTDLDNKLNQCSILEDLNFDSGTIATIKGEISTNQQELSALNRYLSSFLSKSKNVDDNIAISLANLRTVAQERDSTTEM